MVKKAMKINNFPDRADTGGTPDRTPA